MTQSDVLAKAALMGSYDPHNIERELPTAAEKLGKTCPSCLSRRIKDEFLKGVDLRLRLNGYRFNYKLFQRYDDLQQRLPCTRVPGECESTPLGVRSKVREARFWESTHIPMIPVPGKNAPEVSRFSSASRQYLVEGDVNGTTVEALPDSGADMCFISPKLASDLGLIPDPWTRKKIQLANKKCVQSPGMVEVAWRFSKEQKPHILNCWILPGCVHDIVLGSHFLNATKTLTTFKNRIKSKLVDLPRRLRLRLLGEEKQRLWGYLDGHLTAALPDTGSDAMLISSTYARKIGLPIDQDFGELLEVEFADGTTAWTSGVIRDVPWEVGGTTVRCDFHVLDDLCVDVVLSKNYLFDLDVFSESSEYFFNVNSDDDLFQLFNIRLIGRYGDTLNILEEEYLQDVTSPDAFGPESVQRELARRDQIRDEILALHENQRKAATQAEAERQRRWEDLRQAHQTRWITASSASLPSEELSGNDLQGATTRSGFWKKKAGIRYVSFRSLRRSTMP
ncbi:hypothetical protein HFD88_006765 [Aspergillus terreus]|nr:hypothetical protein HFD88_006765 [Aspergillus terreus]